MFPSFRRKNHELSGDPEPNASSNVSRERVKTQVPISLRVCWDGTVQAVYPDPDRKNYVITEDMGTVSADALKAIQPAFEAQKEQYKGELLEGGALMFDVSEDGQIGITVSGPNEFVVGRSPLQNSMVLREGGGVSFLNVDLDKLGLGEPARRLQEAGSHLIVLSQQTDPQ